MSNSFVKLSYFFSRLNLYCAILGAGLLFFIATIICIEVSGRALGAPSRLWVLETSEYSLLYISFLGAPYLLEKKHACSNRHCLHQPDKKIENIFSRIEFPIRVFGLRYSYNCWHNGRCRPIWPWCS